MGIKFQFQPRRCAQAINQLFVLALYCSLPAVTVATAAAPKGELFVARELYKKGEYFKAARFAFAATGGDRRTRARAYSWVTLGLIKSGLHHSASYFFIRTLQTGSNADIRRVLTQTEELLFSVGPDLLRNFLIKHTQAQDYDSRNLSAFYYNLGKQVLLAGKPKRASSILGEVQSSSALYPYALQLLGTANALSGNDQVALSYFRQCQKESDVALGNLDSPGKYHTERWIHQKKEEAKDLNSRCIAGEARTLYQMGQFKESDIAYDKLSKNSFVWTDILFEQGWAAFAQRNYNRTLGRLVSYKSPSLKFVYNPEVEVLTAQAYMNLCLYKDTNEVINFFNRKYKNVGVRIKRYVERNRNGYRSFYEAGKRALDDRLHTRNVFHRVLNRFVRSPYFQNLVEAEKDLTRERLAIRNFDRFHSGVSHRQGEGFPGFLNLVLNWRRKTIRLLGGVFVKNSLLDYHEKLIADFEMMSFIKLEMISRAKEKLAFNRTPVAERFRGNIEPERRDYQYYWSFNGEFWNDEIGDYVFGLESECSQASSS